VTAATAYAALDHRFTVSADDPAISAVLDEILRPLAEDRAGAGAAARYHAAEVAAGINRLTCDNETIATGDAAHAVAMLLWHVNSQAVARSDRYLVMHSAAAALHGSAVLLPGGEEFGKTTFVAALVRAGLDYLSDELVALDPATLSIQAFPKSLSIDEGSWEVLADLRPVTDPALAHATPHQWQVDAERIRPGAAVATAQPLLVVAPRYARGQQTALSPISAAEGLAILAKATFGVGDRPGRDLDALGRLVSQCPCFELRIGDLPTACALVLGLFDDLGVNP
jgi:hypothetical protein